MGISRRPLILAPAALSLLGATRAIGAAAGPPLRVAWLEGNPVQARLGADGRPHGPAIDIAEAVARRLGRPLAIVGKPDTAALLQAVRSGEVDLTFLGYDPTRGEGVLFSAPYLLSPNVYAVASASPLRTAADVDRAGVRIGTIAADSGGLQLRRIIRNATLVPQPNSPTGIAALRAGRIDVLAAPGQRLYDLVPQGGFRLLPGAFHQVMQSIVVRADRMDLYDALSATIAEASASGALAASIRKWKLEGAAAPMPVPRVADAARDLAPGGRLRVAINLGNNVLAQRTPAGELAGISVRLARALAERLKLPLDLTPYPAAGMVFSAMDQGAWDLAFLAVEPERAQKVDFSPPYVYIDGTYLVADGSPFRKAADLDRKGVRISVGRGAAYDLYLTRTLRNAELRRAQTGPEAVQMFLDEKLEAVAGVRQFLADQARGKPGLRILSDSFSRIDQAIGVPKGHAVGAAYVRAFIEEMKASGRVRAWLDETGQASAGVAPPADA